MEALRWVVHLSASQQEIGSTLKTGGFKEGFFAEELP